MNTIIFTSIALAVASTTSFANGGSWLELDQDIASLSSTINMEGGAEVGGLLRSSYRDGGAVGNFGFEDVNIHVGGSLEEFTWRVSADLVGGLTLDDANVSWNQSENLSITWGQQKLPMYRSSSMDQESMLFIDRSLIGAAHDIYDMGVSVSGSNSGLDWTLAAVNGSVTDELIMFAHVDYAIGNGACGCCEGSLHAGEGMDGTLGISYSDEQDDSIDAIVGIDLAMAMGQFSLAAELEDQGDTGDSPSAFTIGYLFADNMEAAFRHEDRDDAGDNGRDTFGLNYYMHGHNAKWAINYIDDDLAADEVIAIGLTVGASR
jgi:hypothetical protein